MTGHHELGRRAALIGTAGLALSALSPSASARGISPPGRRWVRVGPLSDDFEGGELDRTKWNKGLGYDESGAGAFKPANVTVSGGRLRLTATKERYHGHDYAFGAVSSRFDVPGVDSYVDVCAKVLDSRANVLSAIWMQSSVVARTDPNPELDIQETFDYTRLDSHLHTWSTARGHVDYGGHAYDTGVADISTGYHRYGLERRNGRLRFYFDGQLAWDREPPVPAFHDMSRHLLLSLEGHLGAPSDEYLPASCLVDHVHTYYAVPTRATPDGSYRIVNQHSRLVMTAPETLGRPVTQETRASSARQLWTVRRKDDFTYTLRNPATGGLLDLDGGFCQGGTSVVGNPPDPETSRQRWHLLPAQGGFVKVLSKLSGKAAAVPEGDDHPGTTIVERTFGGHSHDKWRLDPARA